MIEPRKGVKGARKLLKETERELEADWQYHDWPAEAVDTIRRLTRKLRQLVGPDPRMSFDEYVEHARAYVKAHPEQRLGQAYFNALYEVHPSMGHYVQTCAPPFNPFYLPAGSPLKPFLYVVKKYWEKT